MKQPNELKKPSNNEPVYIIGNQEMTLPEILAGSKSSVKAQKAIKFFGNFSALENRPFIQCWSEYLLKPEETLFLAKEGVLTPKMRMPLTKFLAKHLNVSLSQKGKYAGKTVAWFLADTEQGREFLKQCSLETLKHIDWNAKSTKGLDQGKSVAWLFAKHEIKSYFFKKNLDAEILNKINWNAAAEDGPDRGKSVIWLHIANNPESHIIYKNIMRPETFHKINWNASAREGEDTGKTVAWVLASADGGITYFDDGIDKTIFNKINWNAVDKFGSTVASMNCAEIEPEYFKNFELLTNEKLNSIQWNACSYSNYQDTTTVAFKMAHYNLEVFNNILNRLKPSVLESISWNENGYLDFGEEELSTIAMRIFEQPWGPDFLASLSSKTLEKIDFNAYKVCYEGNEKKIITFHELMAWSDKGLKLIAALPQKAFEAIDWYGIKKLDKAAIDKLNYCHYDDCSYTKLLRSCFRNFKKHQASCEKVLQKILTSERDLNPLFLIKNPIFFWLASIIMNKGVNDCATFFILRLMSSRKKLDGTLNINESQYLTFFQNTIKNIINGAVLLKQAFRLPRPLVAIIVKHLFEIEETFQAEENPARQSIFKTAPMGSWYPSIKALLKEAQPKAQPINTYYDNVIHKLKQALTKNKLSDNEIKNFVNKLINQLNNNSNITTEHPEDPFERLKTTLIKKKLTQIQRKTFFAHVTTALSQLDKPTQPRRKRKVRHSPQMFNNNKRVKKNPHKQSSTENNTMDTSALSFNGSK